MADSVTKCNLVPAYEDQKFKFDKPAAMNILYRGEAITVVPNVTGLTFSVGKVSMNNKKLCQMFKLDIPSSNTNPALVSPPEVIYTVENLSTESVLYPISSGMILNIDGEVVGEKIDNALDINHIIPKKKIVPYNYTFKDGKVVSVCFEGKPVLYLQGVINTVSIEKESIDKKSDYIITCQGVENSSMLPKEMGIKINYSVRIPNSGPEYIKEVYIRESDEESAYIQFIRDKGDSAK